MRFDKESIIVDLELTTHCNAQCDFCPRDRFDTYGRMGFSTFCKVVERIKALNLDPVVNLCGIGGDPAMHPDLVKFVDYAAGKGLNIRLVTNGSRIDRKMARELLDAGVANVTFSINAIGDAYEQFYGLPFDLIVRNVEDFLEESNGRCRFEINLPQPKGHSGAFEEEKKFWKNLGVKHFLQLKYSNQVVNNAPEEAADLLKKYTEYKSALKKMGCQILCPIPLKVISISYKGEYFLCEHDYTRSSILGNVFEQGIREIQLLKVDYMNARSTICQSCSVINDLHEFSTRIEQGDDGLKAQLINLNDELAETIRVM
ncbi:MAG: radical SAM protein [Pseudomonadales bacterium]|nr:radical SAM protein [Pseudomonadales bacterium]